MADNEGSSIDDLVGQWAETDKKNLAPARMEGAKGKGKSETIKPPPAPGPVHLDPVRAVPPPFARHLPRKNWLPIALAAICGIGLGVFLGLGVASIGGKSLVEVQEERDSPLSQVALPASQTAGWKTGRAIESSYGASSTFGRFAERLEATKWWCPDTYWLLHGNVSLITEATGLQLRNPETGGFVAHLSASFTEHSGDPICNLELDLLKNFWPLPAGACEAVGKAMCFNDSEQRRFRTVAALIPLCSPTKALEGMITVVVRLPAAQRGRFAEKFRVLSRLLKEREWAALHTGDSSEPAINFVLSKRYVACLAFGDWSGDEGTPPSVWSLAITPNDGFSKDPAWVELSESDVDSLDQ